MGTAVCSVHTHPYHIPSSRHPRTGDGHVDKWVKSSSSEEYKEDHTLLEAQVDTFFSERVSFASLFGFTYIKTWVKSVKISEAIIREMEDIHLTQVTVKRWQWTFPPKFFLSYRLQDSKEGSIFFCPSSSSHCHLIDAYSLPFKFSLRRLKFP
jgi:hypothetical protein